MKRSTVVLLSSLALGAAPVAIASTSFDERFEGDGHSEAFEQEFEENVREMGVRNRPPASERRQQSEQQGRDRLATFRQSLCDQLDFGTDLTNNPFVYTNPDAGCDMGFSLPGLPSIGGSLTGLDSCKMLKSVTGDAVRAMNDSMQGAVDDILGGDIGVDVDLSDHVGNTFGDDRVDGGTQGFDANRAMQDALR